MRTIASILFRRADADALDETRLRGREMGEAASQVAAMPGVRAALFALQRRFAADSRGAVLDGRDIGTVICPEADKKLFVTAALAVRAERRWKELSALGDPATLAEVASKHPSVLVCLLSALQFHGLTTQSPFEVWVAIANKARAPKMDYPPLRVVRFSGDALTEGVEKHAVDGVTVQVTSVAKTVADCFKYRNKIGLDVALEAFSATHYEAVAVSDIAASAGVAHGLLFHYFKNKRGLYLAAMEEAAAPIAIAGICK